MIDIIVENGQTGGRYLIGLARSSSNQRVSPWQSKASNRLWYRGKDKHGNTAQQILERSLHEDRQFDPTVMVVARNGQNDRKGGEILETTQRMRMAEL